MLAMRSAGAAMSFREPLSLTAYVAPAKKKRGYGSSGRKTVSRSPVRTACTRRCASSTARRSALGAMTVTRCPAAVSRSASACTWSLTADGVDQRNGVRIPSLSAMRSMLPHAADRPAVRAPKGRRGPLRPRRPFGNSQSVVSQPWQTALAPGPSPLMNSSVMRRHWSSGCCTGGDFMK